MKLRGEVVGRNPGLMSGVVFAGINVPDRPPEQAISTALEAAELDLRRTELLVFSACSTGRGRVAGGEGVLGLQRALQLAGVRSVAASLWQVPDEETHQLMREFYRRVWSKSPVSKAEALRQRSSGCCKIRNAALTSISCLALLSVLLGCIRPFRRLAVTLKLNVASPPSKNGSFFLSGPGDASLVKSPFRGNTSRKSNEGGTHRIPLRFWFSCIGRPLVMRAIETSQLVVGPTHRGGTGYRRRLLRRRY